MKYKDIIDTFTDKNGQKLTTTMFEDDNYVYLDIETNRGVVGDSVAFHADTFLEFADTVASIAQTIKENG